ncbi:hypothetical protein SDC9_151150 [bioreactor metagenome]|uniref:Uncharacterized protein n=1 Tax=bioreactor metagenome TaxID=1076179 RepID=A0A645EPH3_9ZZZZ
MAHFGNRFSVLHFPDHAGNRQFAHAVNQQVGVGACQYRFMQRITPVIVMRNPAEGSFHTSDNQRNVGIEFFQDVGIDRYGPVGAHIRPPVGCVGILRS